MLGLAALAASLEAPKVLAAGPETAAMSGLPKYKFAVITHSTAVAFFVPIRMVFPWAILANLRRSTQEVSNAE
jgi:hypothetical protein